MLLNCGVGEDSWESLGQQGDPLSPSTGNQSLIFIGRTDAKAETPILWPLDMKNWLIWEDPNAGKDWRLDENGTTEDEMAGWHHWLNEHEFEWSLGVGDGHGGLAGCSPWGHNESDTTERLKWDVTLTAFSSNCELHLGFVSLLYWCDWWLCTKNMKGKEAWSKVEKHWLKANWFSRLMWRARRHLDLAQRR